MSTARLTAAATAADERLQIELEGLYEGVVNRHTGRVDDEDCAECLAELRAALAERQQP